MRQLPVLFLSLLVPFFPIAAAEPQRYQFSERASVIDARARAYPEIGFLLEKDGKPADVQHASVDTRVAPQGKLVIWLMAHSGPLFERVNSYGLHIIRVHYANGWFSKRGQSLRLLTQVLERLNSFVCHIRT